MVGLRDWLKRRPTDEGAPPEPLPRPTATLTRPGVVVGSTWMQAPTLAAGGEQQIVGEARRQDVLEALAGGRDDRGCLVRHVTAELVLEPENQYDSDAVRVDVGGRAVGYIPRDEAPDFHPVIAALWAAGAPATCRATLTGGWARPDDRGNIGLCLDIDNELRRADGTVPLIPFGPRVVVTCEEHYQDFLAVLLKANTRLTVPLARLVEHRANPHTPKQAGPAVAVAIGDGVAGYLTPAMAKRYIPLIRHVLEQAAEPTCSGSLKRTEKQIEVRLEVAHPDHLGLRT